MMLGVGVIIWCWWITMVSLDVDLRRGYFPACADSVAIPMFELTVLTIVIAPLLIGSGFLLMRFFGSLPANLATWDRTRRVKSWIVSIVAVALMLVVGGALTVTIPTSSASAAPALVVALYLLAATRAALVSSGA